MAEYGMIYDANNIKRQLYESNRGYNQRKSWENLFLQNDLVGQKSNTQANTSFAEVMNTAYMSSMAGNRQIAGSNLGQGFKDTFFEQNEQDIQKAYDTYSQNLADTRQSINDNVYENALSIEQAALNQSEYIKDYADQHFKYLEQLYADYEAGNNTVFDDPQWSKYLFEVKDNAGVATGEKRLLTRDELTAPAFIEGINKEKEWTSLYDSEGNLTTRGLDFFDQMENQNLTSNSFGSYLTSDKYEGETTEQANRRQELYEWSKTYNPYNYTFEGTNKGTFKTMVGMSSMDNTYAFAERFGGMTKTQVDNMYGKFETAFKDLAVASKNAKSTTKEISGLVTNIKKMAQDLGIDGDFDFDSIQAEADAYVQTAKDGGDLAGDWFSTVGAFTAGGAAEGLGIGAIVGGGAFTGLSAPTGTVIGGVIGAIGGIVKASIDVSKNKKTNTKIATNSKELYSNLLNQMINYSQAKRRQSEIDFNSQNNRF